MLKILIVEDELLTRIGIESMVKWEENGFTIVGIAENGRQGLELAMKHKPDIVITDIMMPRMNGIELMKALKNTDSAPQFLILSGYNEYQYVREALKLGAVDYILKLDIEPKLLLDVLGKIKNNLDDKRTESDFIISWNEQSAVILKLFQGKILPVNEIDRVLRKNNIELPEKNIILIMIKDFSDQNDMLQEGFYPSSRTILRTINELLQHFGTTYGCTVKNMMFFNILSLNSSLDPGSLYNLKIKIEKELHDYFQKIYNISLAVYFSGILNSFSLLNREYKILIETSYGTGDRSSIDSATAILSNSKNILSAIKNDNYNSVDITFSALIENIPDYKDLSREFLYGICFSLLNEMGVT